MPLPDYFAKAAIAEAASFGRMKAERKERELKARIAELEARIKKLEAQQ